MKNWFRIWFFVSLFLAVCLVVGIIIVSVRGKGGWWIIALIDVVGAVVNLLLMFRYWRAWSSEEWHRKEKICSRER